MFVMILQQTFVKIIRPRAVLPHVEPVGDLGAASEANHRVIVQTVVADENRAAMFQGLLVQQLRPGEKGTHPSEILHNKCHFVGIYGRQNED